MGNVMKTLLLVMCLGVSVSALAQDIDTETRPGRGSGMNIKEVIASRALRGVAIFVNFPRPPRRALR